LASLAVASLFSHLTLLVIAAPKSPVRAPIGAAIFGADERARQSPPIPVGHAFHKTFSTNN
jgi:hypothetical protein